VVEAGRVVEVLVKCALVGCTSDGVVKHDVSEDLEQRLRAGPCRRAGNVVGSDDEGDRWRDDGWSVW
jgi:hypothetical protein